MAIVGEGPAPKITGMLIDLEPAEVVRLLENEQELKSRVLGAQKMVVTQSRG